MEIRYYRSRWTKAEPPRYVPHIWVYDVVGVEVRAVLTHAGEDLPACDGARMALGQIKERERFLRVIYVPDAETGAIFVIAAFTLRGKVLKACRARQRSRGRHHDMRPPPDEPPVPMPVDGYPEPERHPKGWDEERVRRVIAHYEMQDENSAVAEDEAALGLAV
jgi:hypothetical protein